jgi:hypothetical protein
MKCVRDKTRPFPSEPTGVPAGSSRRILPITDWFQDLALPVTIAADAAQGPTPQNRAPQLSIETFWKYLSQAQAPRRIIDLNLPSVVPTHSCNLQWRHVVTTKLCRTGFAALLPRPYRL